MLRLASLCFPDREKSCFYCCPPIREADADPLDDREKKKELFRRHRRQLAANIAGAGEIYGDSCWGLGFLDDGERQIGCLLHPLQNDGCDRRSLTGYQAKCAGTLCQEAVVFGRLPRQQQQFFLQLSSGLDSFHYSSRRANPLMKILPWGGVVLAAIYRREKGRSLAREEFSRRYGFLWRELDARLDSWLLEELEKRQGPDAWWSRHRKYRAWRQRLLAELREAQPLAACGGGPTLPVHRLHIPLNLSRLFKFGLGIWEATAAEANAILAVITRELEIFAGE